MAFVPTVQSQGRIRVIGAINVTSILKSISGENAWNVLEVQFAITNVRFVEKMDTAKEHVKW